MEHDLLEKKNLSSLEFDPEDLRSIPEGGMGLVIIKEIMDSTGYKTEDGKNHLTMTKKLPSKS